MTTVSEGAGLIANEGLAPGALYAWGTKKMAKVMTKIQVTNDGDALLKN